MRNRITYDTPVDALAAFATRLGIHENRGGMSSSEFFDRYMAGEFPCEDRFTEWAMDYRNFLYLRNRVVERMDEKCRLPITSTW